MEVPVVILPLTSPAWLAERADATLSDNARGFEAYRGGKLVASAAFDSWSANSCVAYVAIEDPIILRHNFLQTCFTFAFTYANRGVILSLIPGHNRKSLRFCKHLGFSELCRIRDGYQVGVDNVLMELRKEDCRWLLPLNEEAA